MSRSIGSREMIDVISKQACSIIDEPVRSLFCTPTVHVRSDARPLRSILPLQLFVGASDRNHKTRENRTKRGKKIN